MKRSQEFLTALLALALGIPCLFEKAEAGVPDPSRAVCEIRGQGAACQFRFRADGGLDRMTVFVTLRDAFDAPVVACSTSATMNLVGPSEGGSPCGWSSATGAELCSCCDLVQGGISNAVGAVAFEFSRIGGRGLGEMAVTAHCVGSIAIAHKEFHFTSPDLDGTCEEEPNASTTIVDFALYASCLPPSPICRPSDYDCDCLVTVLDLAFYAGGLGKGCSKAGCD